MGTEARGVPSYCPDPKCYSRRWLKFSSVALLPKDRPLVERDSLEIGTRVPIAATCRVSHAAVGSRGVPKQFWIVSSTSGRLVSGDNKRGRRAHTSECTNDPRSRVHGYPLHFAFQSHEIRIGNQVLFEFVFRCVPSFHAPLCLLRGPLASELDDPARGERAEG